MNGKDKLGWLKALAVSRKFWALLIVAITAVVLYVQGAIDAEALITTLVALGGFLVTTIAAEDVAEKVGRPRPNGAARGIPSVTHPIGEVVEPERVTFTVTNDVPGRWRGE